MKQSIRAYLLSVLVLFAPMSANAGIPTTDPGQLAAMAVDIAQKIAHYAKLLSEAEKRFDKLKSTLETNQGILSGMTGERTLGNFEFDKTLRLEMPQDWQNMYERFNDPTKNEERLGEHSDIYLKIVADQGCESISYAGDENDCKRRAAKQAYDQGMIINSMQSMDDRIANIDKLMEKINEVNDHKEMQALTARIEIEQTSLEAESMKVDMYQRMMEIQDDLFTQREANSKLTKFESENVIQITPIEW